MVCVVTVIAFRMPPAPSDRSSRKPTLQAHQKARLSAFLGDQIGLDLHQESMIGRPYLLVDLTGLEPVCCNVPNAIIDIKISVSRNLVRPGRFELPLYGI